MAAQIKPDIPVLFLDTGMLFGQTLDYRKPLAATPGPDRRARPASRSSRTWPSHDPSADLWKTDTDACCHIRKVLPLDRALAGFDGWITGRKRFHGGDRLRLQVVEAARGQAEVQPAGQLGQGRARRLRRRARPARPPAGGVRLSLDRLLALHQPVEEGEDVRAGRWAGSQKTECGIHTARAPGAAPNFGGDI